MTARPFAPEVLADVCRAAGGDERLCPSARLVLALVTMSTDWDTGRSVIGSPTLAADSGLDAGNCRNLVGRLVECGWLDVVQVRPGRSNVYRITDEAISTGRALRARLKDASGARVARGGARPARAGARPARAYPVTYPVVDPRRDDNDIPGYLAERWADRLGGAR